MDFFGESANGGFVIWRIQRVVYAAERGFA